MQQYASYNMLVKESWFIGNSHKNPESGSQGYYLTGDANSTLFMAFNMIAPFIYFSVLHDKPFK